MATIGDVPEINVIKRHLEQLKQNGIITQWELPYENLLTRLSAAIFFISGTSDGDIQLAWKQLSAYDNFRQRKNEEKQLSQLEYRVEFG